MLKLGLPNRTCWTNSQSVQPIEKNFETLIAYFSKNKESNKKKMTLNSEPGWGGYMIETMQRVYKMGLPNGTCWTGFHLVQPIEKISETLTEDSLKNKESKKK